MMTAAGAMPSDMSTSTTAAVPIPKPKPKPEPEMGTSSALSSAIDQSTLDLTNLWIGLREQFGRLDRQLAAGDNTVISDDSDDSEDETNSSDDGHGNGDGPTRGRTPMALPARAGKVRAQIVLIETALHTFLRTVHKAKSALVDMEKKATQRAASLALSNAPTATFKPKPDDIPPTSMVSGDECAIARAGASPALTKKPTPLKIPVFHETSYHTSPRPKSSNETGPAVEAATLAKDQDKHMGGNALDAFLAQGDIGMVSEFYQSPSLVDSGCEHWYLEKASLPASKQFPMPPAQPTMVGMQLFQSIQQANAQIAAELGHRPHVGPEREERQATTPQPHGSVHKRKRSLSPAGSSALHCFRDMNTRLPIRVLKTIPAARVTNSRWHNKTREYLVEWQDGSIQPQWLTRRQCSEDTKLLISEYNQTHRVPRPQEGASPRGRHSGGGQSRRRHGPAAAPGTSVSDEIYMVDCIVDDRIFRKRKQYFVKWEGYDTDENTWEPAQKLRAEVPEVVDEYERGRAHASAQSARDNATAVATAKEMNGQDVVRMVKDEDKVEEEKTVAAEKEKEQDNDMGVSASASGVNEEKADEGDIVTTVARDTGAESSLEDRVRAYLQRKQLDNTTHVGPSRNVTEHTRSEIAHEHEGRRKNGNHMQDEDEGKASEVGHVSVAFDGRTIMDLT